MKKHDKFKVAIVREEGSNGEREMASAFYYAGFHPVDVTMTDLMDKKFSLQKFRGIVFVGGFSYADTMGAASGWATVITKNTILFEKIKKKTSKIDCLINNVGIAGPTATLENISTDDWENTMRVNVFSHYYFTRLAIPMLKKNKGGSIINISSGAGIMGFPLRSPYAASKWAIVGMTKTLSMELGKFKIRVNALCPGTIKGDRMIRVAKDKAKLLKISKKSIEKEFISMASMNCWIYEEDIGKICSFLISREGERISGQTIPVDGNATRLD